MCLTFRRVVLASAMGHTSQTYVVLRQHVDCVGSIGCETLAELVGAGVRETAIADPSLLSYPQGHTHVAKWHRDPEMASLSNGTPRAVRVAGKSHKPYWMP